MKGYKMKTERKKFGFTIVELLTVMSVIALLLGLLVPALSLVRRMAKDVKQKGQFHSIDVALEMFSSENDGYPCSNFFLTSGKYTVGAHHLAEALVGRDLLGFDPQTTWNAQADEGGPVYGNGTPAEDALSLDRRKGPYLASENVEAFQIQQLYADRGNVYNSDTYPSPVLTDCYRIKTVVLSNGKQVKAGTPILYYKANTSSKLFPDAFDAAIADDNTPGYIYNSRDNEELIALGHMMDQTQMHHFDYLGGYTAAGNDGRQIFYDAITNPKITSQFRPYNATSYLLISAGFDGIYGTPDDIYNFSE
jgi:prepilin-type N-terminal cleavage/methylation domain-containing protein